MAGISPVWAGCQVIGLVAAGAYRETSMPGRVARLAVGLVIGTVAAGLLGALVYDRTPASRAFYLVVPLVTLAGLSLARIAGHLLAVVGRGDRTRSPFIDRTTFRASPLAMAANVVRRRALLQSLVLRDLKLKYRGSVLGFFWSLLNPLAMVAAYTLAFQYILQTGQERYPFSVLVGLLAWSFFANSSTMSTGSMIDSAGLLKAAEFPRAALPTATVLFNLSQYLLATLVFVPLLMLIYRTPPSAALLAFPALLALQFLVTLGAALALSTCTAYFRDIRHLTDVSLRIMFWTTPVLYSVDRVGGAIRGLIMLSPLSPYILGYQRIFYQGAWPEASIWILAGAYAVASLTVGGAMFYALEDRVGEQL